MPYLFEENHLKIPKSLNKTIKLSDSDRQEIKRLYNHISQRKLAALFGVSRRLIQFMGDPEKAEKNRKRRQLNSLFYYSKNKHIKYMKKYRNRKQELYLNDLLNN
jgi:hypothetical protein